MERSASSGVGQAGEEVLADQRRVAIVRFAGRLLCAGFSTCLIMSFIGPAKASPPPSAQTSLERVDLHRAGRTVVRSDVLETTDNPLSDRGSGFVEFLSLVTPQREVVPEKRTGKEGNEAKKLRVRPDSFLSELDDAGLYAWFLLCFIAGLIVGGAFGWPPFSRR
jgi:hypothetical protein